eukprot:c12598_g1_i1.p1 GENE.c12598_g1_i1~~c12598_g1_i1.p1  ORF type:complete len:969 (+),score=255.88 c12598_g1_i1:493-3399(+)
MDGSKEELYKAVSELAVATQRASALLDLRQGLLDDTLSELKRQIADTVGYRKFTSWKESRFRKEFVEPMEKQAGILETKMTEAKILHSETQVRFRELRQIVTRPLMQLLRECTDQYGNEFAKINLADLERLNKVVGTINSALQHHNITGKLRQKMIEISPDDAAVEEQGSHDTLTTNERATDSRRLEYLRCLYVEANKAKSALEAILDYVRRTCRTRNAHIQTEMAPLKSIERAIEKSVEDYAGDFSYLLDIVRATVVCNTASDLILVLQTLSDLSFNRGTFASPQPIRKQQSSVGRPAVKVEMTLVRVKNRLDPNFNAASASGGYRDMLLNLRMADGHLCEVQLQLRGFLDLKHGGGHNLYTVARSLHLLDSDLGHVRVSGAGTHYKAVDANALTEGMRLALSRIASGTCQTLYLNHVKLSLRECKALREAFLSDACNVFAVSMPVCGLDRDKCLALLGVSSIDELKPATVVTNMDTAKEEKGKNSKADKTSKKKKKQNKQIAPVAPVPPPPKPSLGKFRFVDLRDNQGILGAFVGAMVSSDLEDLSIRECRLDQSEIMIFCESMHAAHLTHLKKLVLAENDVGGMAASALAEAVFDAHHITELDLKETKLHTADIQKLARSLAVMHDMRILNFAGNPIGKEGAKSLAEPLTHMTNLESLNLEAAGIEFEGLSSIAEALKHMPKLESLALRNNNLGIKGVKCLLPVLQSSPHLKLLGIKGNDIGPRGAAALASSLAHLTHLTSLGLGANAIKAEGAHALAPALQSLTSMITLGVADNQIGVVGMTAIAPALKQMTNMTALYIGGNELGPQGAVALAPVLAAMPLISTLSFLDNNLGAEGMATLVPTLSAMPKIAILMLSNNNIGSAGAQSLATALPNMPLLVNLDLNKNEIGPEGAVALGSAFLTTPMLDTVTLQGNVLGNEGVLHLVSVVSQMAQLDHLNLAGNGFDAAVRAELETTLTSIHKLLL